MCICRSLSFVLNKKYTKYEMVEEEEITAASAAVVDDDKKLKVKIQ